MGLGTMLFEYKALLISLLGTNPLEVTTLIRYYIIDNSSPYNIIIRRPTLFSFRDIIFTPHMKVKFPTAMGLSELKTDNEASLFCYSASLCMSQT